MVDEKLSRKSHIIPWSLFGFVTLLPLMFWGFRIDWQFDSLSKIIIFPMLGIVAWGIMWTHYAYGALRVVYPNLQKNWMYSKVSSYVVLALILLHPAILAVYQFRLREALPPQSFYDYVGDSLKIFVIFGSLSLLMFLSYEVLDRLRQKKWVNKYWFLISISQMVAMTLIFFHGLALGGNLDNTLLEFYWISLGALLIPCFGLIGHSEWLKATSQ